MGGVSGDNKQARIMFVIIMANGIIIQNSYLPHLVILLKGVQQEKRAAVVKTAEVYNRTFRSRGLLVYFTADGLSE